MSEAKKTRGARIQGTNRAPEDGVEVRTCEVGEGGERHGYYREARGSSVRSTCVIAFIASEWRTSE